MTNQFSDIVGFRPWFLPDDLEPTGYAAEKITNELLRQGLMKIIGARLTLRVPGPLNDAFEDVRSALSLADLIGPQRNEHMPVRRSAYGQQIAEVDRSAMRILGLWATKIHVNGLVRTDGSAMPRVWLSRRSPASMAAPMTYDTMIAGGQPVGSTSEDTLAKEAEEEVGMPASISCSALKIRDVVVQYHSDLGLHREVLSIYDLSVPQDFVPDHRDGEIVDSVLLDWAGFRAALDGALALKHSSRLVSLDLVSRFSSALI